MIKIVKLPIQQGFNDETISRVDDDLIPLFFRIGRLCDRAHQRPIIYTR